MADPGWYADPLGFKYYRYFNGNEWTVAVRDSETDDVDPLKYTQTLFLKNLPPPETEPISTSAEEISFLALYKESRQNETELGISTDGIKDIRKEISGRSKREIVEEIFNPSNISDHKSRGVDDPRQEGWIVGQSGMVRFQDGLVEIKRTSIGMDLIAGNIRGDKAIPLRTIQAIQFKPASTTVGGMIEFVVAGDRSNNGRQRVLGNGIASAIAGRRFSRMGDENVITFNRTQEPPFREFHNFLLNALKEYDSVGPPQDQLKQNSLADEIRELKQLLDEGLLTIEEFESAKKSILGI